VSKSDVEIRDPLHVFIRLLPKERAALNSRPMQRLRFIHQLSMSYLVYPGATHRRFEHSLGVMELVTRIFNIITDQRHLNHDEARDVMPPDDDAIGYWRAVLRMAALFHDTGHLPFSHGAEKELLPEGWDHERLSRELILSDEMRKVWASMEPPLTPEHIALLAVGPAEGETLPPWQALLNEIITGNVFGADRMDYLLRDSHHAGVQYGRFDHFRLIDTMRILPAPRVGGSDGSASREPSLGIEDGGRESAEALLLARYAMFSQVYLHRTRRIYDLHLVDFAQQWLTENGYEDGRFPTDIDGHLALTDNELLTAIYAAAAGPAGRLRTLARRITDRNERYVAVYEPSPGDLATNVEAAGQVAAALAERYDEDAVRHDKYAKVDDPFDFSLERRDGEVISSASASELLGHVPAARHESVYCDRQHLSDAKQWLGRNKDEIIQPTAHEADDDETPDGKEGT
jgi:HD superfamily phosphohydrolase